MTNGPKGFRVFNMKDKKMYEHTQDYAVDGQGRILYKGELVDNQKKYHVMFDTGLRDKENVRIYAGDYVRLELSERTVEGVVYFNKYYGGFSLESDPFELLNKSNERNMRVIGNLYDGKIL